MDIFGSLYRGRRALALVTAALVAGLWGAPPAAAADTTPPAAPGGFTLTPENLSTDGQIYLDWSASSSGDVVAYQVYRFHGDGAPALNERTYVAETGVTSFHDDLAREGAYRYAVVAVDAAGNKSRPTPWRAVTVNKNGGGVTPDTTAPGAPTRLEAAERHLHADLVDLSWTPPVANDLWRYLVYRAKGGGAAAFAAYVEADLPAYTDEVTADDTYTYYVMAQDLSGNVGPASASVTVRRDTAAPLVSITGPADGIAYRGAGKLAVTAKVADTGAGFEPDAVEVYLDGHLQRSPVIDLSALGQGVYEVEVRVADRAGNTGSDQIYLYVNDDVAYDAPAMLTDSGFTRSRTVSLNWAPPQRSGVTGYYVYRTGPDGQTEQVGSLGSSARSFSQTVPADGLWSYYVVARYGSAAKGSPSPAVGFVVDRTAPTVAIASPGPSRSYKQEGRLSIAYAVDDAVSGPNLASVTVQLDGRTFTGSSISLAGLSAGEHTLKVTASDLAGNESYATARFTVVPATDRGGDDDDDDDDEGDDHRGGRDLPDWSYKVTPQVKAEILKELAKHKDEIHHGHYRVLEVFAQHDSWRSFVFHLYKHQGRFIPKDVAERLLKMLDADDLQIDKKWWKGEEPPRHGSGGHGRP